MSHWLTLYYPDNGEPYGTVCHCPIGDDHEADGTLADPFGDDDEPEHLS